ncbi:hypothetical protein SYNPS1DRAFT_28470 [Syncephalis pseudoplumigaleata]|uniref:F-box domain-containing protein n=1 Tax=Syncephalis pseudoplumigaleata TaxID=1712513 RepID=A0A4P9Z044_9FUNG|nr:hypothetical protein SYNPS1DRAFT_28470 [Syncephalis pseudoplumigaleata]|eukprot:RKP25807.1 hypothetical protein SYNPS1DRAFT_28470 [Syncephalis pseudoplumigaleata]
MVMETLPWDVRRFILASAGEVAAARLARTCRVLYGLVRHDVGLWQQFYARSYLRDAQRVEHEFLEWCSEEIVSTATTTTTAATSTTTSNPPSAMLPHQHQHQHQQRGRRRWSEQGHGFTSGAFADARARWKQAQCSLDTSAMPSWTAEQRRMDWYAAYRRRAATEANWCAGRYLRHCVPPPVMDVRTEASLYFLGGSSAPRMMAGSVAGLLILQGDRLYCIYQPRSSDATYYKMEELDLQAETAGVLQVRAAHMSGQWIVVELHDPQYPEAGGSLSAWRIGSRQASSAAELKEHGERVQEVRGRWALLTRREQGATVFSVVDLELGIRSVAELRVHCRSAEILHVDHDQVHLLVNEQLDGQRDDGDDGDTSASLKRLALVQELALTANYVAPSTESPSPSSSSSAATTPVHDTSTPSPSAMITCVIYALSLEALPATVTSVTLPSPPHVLSHSLRIRVIDARRILLEYIESGSYDVRVVVHRLDISLTTRRRSWPFGPYTASQRDDHDDGDGDGDGDHEIVLVSWYRRRPVVIRDCTATWTQMNAHDAAAGYIISPSLGRSGLLFHSEYFEGDATLMDMSTWQSQCSLGYWAPAVGPNLVTPTFIARMKEGDRSIEVWNFASW